MPFLELSVEPSLASAELIPWGVDDFRPPLGGRTAPTVFTSAFAESCISPARMDDRLARVATDRAKGHRHVFGLRKDWDAEAYCRALLGTGDFLGSTLSRYVEKGRTCTKAQLADALAKAIVLNGYDPHALMLDYCRQPRFWLAYATFDEEPTREHRGLGTAREFFAAQSGTSRFYGPWHDPEENVTWLVYAQHFTDRVVDDAGPPVDLPIRWHAVIRLDDDCVSVHWHGFSHRPAEKDANVIQFEYWRHVPAIFGTLQQMLGVKLQWPAMGDLVLDQLRASYLDDDEYEWKDLRIRAEKNGVALNARSSRIKLTSVAGLQSLAREVSKSALVAAGHPATNRELDQAEPRVLLTLIKEWGTKSYEFSVDLRRPDPLDKKRKCQMRGHCYFGNGKDGEDSFPHVHCYDDSGGSHEALSFLRRENRGDLTE